MARAFQIRILNDISAHGLSRLPVESYKVSKDIETPDAILVRSADMHELALPPTVLAIGRAGAGTNNIPIDAMSRRGIPVFNTPGANANAVKELVLAGLLLAARHLPDALSFVAGLAPSPEMDRLVEDGKKRFSGREIAGQTLGVIGLGKIGCLVADAAIKLDMRVIGFDPNITVDAAWSLPSQVRRAGSIAELLRASDFVTLHVPLVAATRHLIGARELDLLRPGTTLLNFSREAVVDEQAIIEALDARRLACYVCDFPGPNLAGRGGVIALPHLGASTREAEDNCASMVADQIRAYLEDGNIRNSVNFPEVTLARGSGYRVAIANANVPNMLGQISTAMAQAGLNIHDMINKSLGEIAYTLVDVDSPVPPALIQALRAIDGVLAVRYLPAA